MAEYSLTLSKVVWHPVRFVLSGMVVIISTILMGGCASETLLSAQFNNEAVDEPPAIEQEVGKIHIGCLDRPMARSISPYHRK